MAAAAGLIGISSGEKEDSNPPQKVNITFRRGDVYACHFEPGDKYEGDFVDGKRHGKGVNTWANRAKYDGDWKDDKRHGKGVFTENQFTSRRMTGAWGR